MLKRIRCRPYVKDGKLWVEFTFELMDGTIRTQDLPYNWPNPIRIRVGADTPPDIIECLIGVDERTRAPVMRVRLKFRDGQQHDEHQPVADGYLEIVFKPKPNKELN